MMYVCRLCSSDKNVIDLFHSELKYGEKLRFCILLATGIEIQKGDVSTMICQNCCEIAVKLYKYRIHAISNDQVLKQKSGQVYELPALDPEKLKSIAVSVDKNFFNDSEPTHRIKELDERISNCDDNVTILKVGSSLLKITRVSAGEALSSIDNSNNSLQEITKMFKSVVSVHPSVKQILNENKNLILPAEVYGDNVSPLVSLNTEAYEEWRAKQIRLINLELGDILPDSPLSIDVRRNSNDRNNDSFTVTTNLRKRTYRRIIVDSDSDNDVPDKIPKTVVSEVRKNEVTFSQNATTTTNLQKPTSRTAAEQVSLADSRITIKSSSSSDKVTLKELHKEVHNVNVSSGSGNVNMFSPTSADKEDREDLIIKFEESRSTVEPTDNSDQVISNEIQKRAHIDDTETTNQNLNVSVVSDRRSTTNKSSSNLETASILKQRLGIVCNVEVVSDAVTYPRTNLSGLQITIESDSDGEEDISKKLQTPMNKHNVKTYSISKAGPVAMDRKNIAVKPHANHENVAIETLQPRILNGSAFDASKDTSRTVQKGVPARSVDNRNLQTLGPNLPILVASERPRTIRSILPKTDSEVDVISKKPLEGAHASANDVKTVSVESERRSISAKPYANNKNVTTETLQPRIINKFVPVHKKVILTTVPKGAQSGSVSKPNLPTSTHKLSANKRARSLESLQPPIIIECDSDSEEVTSKKPLKGANNRNVKTSIPTLSVSLGSSQTNTMDNLQSKHENVVATSLQPRISNESASISETQKVANIRNESANNQSNQNSKVSVASEPRSTTEVIQPRILNEYAFDNNKDITITVQKGVPVGSVGNRNLQKCGQNLSVPITSERLKTLRQFRPKSASNVNDITKKSEEGTPVKNLNEKSPIQTLTVPVTKNHTRTIDKSQSNHGNLVSESLQPQTTNESASASTIQKGGNIRNETAKNQNLNVSVRSGSRRATVKPKIQTAEALQPTIVNKCAPECNENTTSTIKKRVPAGSMGKRKLRTYRKNLPAQVVNDEPKSVESLHPQITIECDSDSDEDISKKLQKDGQGRRRSVGDQYKIKTLSQNATGPSSSANGGSRNKPQSNQETESIVPQILIESDSESEVTSQNKSTGLRDFSPITPSGNGDRPTSDANATDQPRTNLDSVFAEFNEHSINIETSEPSAAVSCEKDINNIEDDADVICLSDEQESTARSMSHIFSEIMLLFTKHYNFDYKPKTVDVKCKNKGTTVLQNMVTELNKHSVPVEIENVSTNQITFLKNDCFKFNLKKRVLGVWGHDDCTDIQKPAGQVANTVPKVQNTDNVQKKNGGYQVIYRTAIPTATYQTTTNRTSLKKAPLTTPSTSLKKSSTDKKVVPALVSVLQKNTSHNINDSNIKSPAPQVICSPKIGYTKNQQFGVTLGKHLALNTYGNKKKEISTQASTTASSIRSISNNTAKSISKPVQNVPHNKSLSNIKMVSSVTSLVLTPLILQPVTVTTSSKPVTQTTWSTETSSNEIVNNNNINFKAASMDKSLSSENTSANGPISVIPVTNVVSNASVVNNAVTSGTYPKVNLSFYPSSKMVMSKVSESPDSKQPVKVSPKKILVPINKSSKSWQMYNSLEPVSTVTSSKTVTTTVTSKQSDIKPVSSELLKKSQPTEQHQQPELAHRRIGVIRVKNLSELLKK